MFSFFYITVTKFSFLLVYLLSGCTMLTMAGCKKTEMVEAPPTPAPAPTVLVDAKKIGHFTPAQIKARFGEYPQIGLFVKNAVNVYKLVYRTKDPNGVEIQASGALLVPDTSASLPLLSLQHGTITSEASAPSNFSKSSEAGSFGLVMASVGYIVSAPDYIGYGASKQLPHPYEHAATLASASFDMLQAGREWIEKQQVRWNEQLFLTGYSEGGYATMALHRYIEQNHGEQWTVTASAPGAGAYDKTAFAKYILKTNQSLSFINSYLWVLKTYDSVYHLNKPYAYYLNEPYASRVKKGGVHVDVSKNPQQLFTAEFRKGILQGSNQAMLEVFADNDIYDWKPKAAVALFHGTADDFVPLFNSQHAYDAMQARGATQVQLRKINGGNHFTSILPFTLEVLEFFYEHQQQ